MPTVVKTWSTWDTTVVGENLADAGNNTNIAYAKDATDVAAKFTDTAKSQTGIIEYARQAAASTWEDWGVPAGAIVTQVQVTAWKKKLVANTKLSSHNLTVDVVDDTSASVHSAGNLLNVALGTSPVDSSYAAQAAGTARVVDAGHQASSCLVKLQLKYTLTTTGSSGNAAVDQRFDDLQLTITYSLPSIGGDAALGIVAGLAAAAALAIAAAGAVGAQPGLAADAGAAVIAAASLPCASGIAAGGTVADAGVSGAVSLGIAAQLVVGGLVDVGGSGSPMVQAGIAGAGTSAIAGSTALSGELGLVAAGAAAVRGNTAVTVQAGVTGGATAAIQGAAALPTIAPALTAAAGVRLTGSGALVLTSALTASGVVGDVANGDALLGLVPGVAAGGAAQIGAQGAVAGAGAVTGQGVARVAGSGALVHADAIAGIGVVRIAGAIDLPVATLIGAGGACPRSWTAALHCCPRWASTIACTRAPSPHTASLSAGSRWRASFTVERS